jgi:site-specific recombinase XerD
LLLDEGVDPFLIQQILGHSKLAMTQHYSRASQDVKQAAVERLGRRLAGRSESA